jgi:thiamine pyrophosphokinase
MKINKCIIIANGKPPIKKTINYFLDKGYDTIICADGGANSAKKVGLVPDYIIGDFDSINASTIKHFKGKSIFLKYKRQNDTDIEKCLKFAVRKNIKETILLGATGDRLDHTICNLGIVIKFYKQIKISIVAEKSFLTAHNSDLILKSKAGETISLYAFDTKTKITSSRLKYKLSNATLPFGQKESTSNVSISDVVKLNISEGIVFVIRDFNFMKKYDLF